MSLWTELARAQTLAGDEIMLRQRDALYEIRFNGLNLMSNLNHHSEEVMAVKSLQLFEHHPKRVLVGGLGMGFTLKALLQALPQDCEVVVVELVPAIVDWNRSHLAALNGGALDDPRLRLEIGDLFEVLAREKDGFDLILIDTDNGPEDLARDGNAQIWREAGIELAMAALRPGGVVTFWSAEVSAGFERDLDRAGMVWRRAEIALIPGRVDAMHQLYFAAKDARAFADRLAQSRAHKLAA